MKLNDEVIAHIAKLLQIALLTGTDIVDNLRMLRLQEEENELYLEAEYAQKTIENIEKMLNKITTLT